MKYIITRTSDWSGKEQPCSQAFQDGTDKYGHPIWRVDINSLDDLQSIIKECDASVIVGLNDLEIYDDFRE